MTSSFFLVGALLASFAVAILAGGVTQVVMPANPLNDPDLPNYVAPLVDMAAGSIVIPFGTLQGQFDRNGTHIFNFPVYGLVAHLLWRDIPVRFALRGGKTASTNVDFSVSTVRLWPRTPAAELTTAQVRDFDGGAFVVPANLARFAWVHILDYVNGSARLERTAYCEPNTTVVFNATAAFQIPQRYVMNTKPFISVMDSSSFAFVQVLYLRWAGFVFGQHYKQMNYDEANAINGDTCVSYISEPHFKPGSTDALRFQSGMRSFVEAGGNFIAQCGGVGTYEQCDLGRGSPVALSSCPNGFLATSAGGFRLYDYQTGHGRLPNTWRLDQEANYASDTLYGQYIGPWTWAYGDIESMTTWTTGAGTVGIGSTLNIDNAGHWVVGANAVGVPGNKTFFSAHSKLARYHGKTGGNVFYLAGHEYTPFDGRLTRFNDFRIASPAGARQWLNGALHPANRSGCRATITLPDGTIRDIGELTIDPCRYDSSAPECNTVYDCTAPKFSGYYKEGWNYGVELIADYPLTFTMNVTLPNRVAIMNVLDANGFFTSSNSDSNSGNDNRLTSLHRVLPYLYPSLETTWNRVWAAEVLSTESNSYYNLVRTFVSSRTAFVSSAPVNLRSGTSRVLHALLAGLQDTNLLWDGSLRVIHLYTNSSNPSVPSGLVAALNVLRPAVVIVVPTSALRTVYANLNLPRTTVIVNTFPNFATPRDIAESSVGPVAANFLAPVITATNDLLSNFNITRDADPLGLSSTVTTATLNLATQNVADTTLTAVANQPLTLALTGGYGIPGGPTFSPMPYRLQWAVDGLDFRLTTAIFWSEFASSLPFTATVLENTDVTVPIVSRLRLSASTTSNRNIFIQVLNITKNGGTTDVWDTDFAYVKTGDGNTTQRGLYYRADDFIFRTNLGSFGNYTVNYRVYDRCVRSESTIQLGITRLNARPVGSNFTYQMLPGENVTIDWFAPIAKINDRETPNNLLRFSFDANSVPSSGTLQVFVGNAWTNLVPSTLYNVSTPIRFLSNTLSDTNSSFLYNVWDGDNTNNLVVVYARFEFTAPPNVAPVISVNPASNPTLTTAQNTTATFTVTVTDFIADLTTELHVESISVAWDQLTTLRPTGAVDTRTYSLFNTELSGSVLIDVITLTAGASNNTRTFNFDWSPFVDAPFGATYTFVLYAQDPRGLISNKVTVTLRTPANIAPVVVGFVTPNANPTFPESATLVNRSLTISSTDANLIHTEKLNLTILSLPFLGTLYRSDCVTAIAVGDVIDFTVQSQSGGRTISPVCYVPQIYTSGVDSFSVRATDLANLPSPVVPLEIVITAGNFPPVSANVTRSTETPITFTIPSSDPDGDAVTFTIITVSVPSELGVIASNASGAAIAPGQSFPPTAADNNGYAQRFTYTPNSNVTAHVVNFTYRVTDPSGLNSSVYWAIINYVTDYIPPIPPVSTNSSFTTPEDIPLVINFDPLVTDIDGVPIQIKIVSTNNNTLLGPTGSPLSDESIVSVSPNGSLIVTYVPPPDFFGTITFTYAVIDDQGLISNTTTITITVSPVNDAPLIEATPSVVVIQRAQVGSFTINISDIDSTTVSLLIAADNSVPQPSTLSSGAWTLNGAAEVIVINVTNSVLGAETAVTIDWTPAIALLDGSSGTFTVFAYDTELLSSVSRPVLRVEVVGNDAPTIVPTYTYSFTVNEDFANFDITLAGTDLQTFHREVLDVIIKSLPSVSAIDLLQSNASVQLGVIASTGANGETAAIVTASAKPNFNGNVTFSFEVRDLLGAISSVQIVNINVLSVNDPPISADEIIVVQESTCFSSAVNCPDNLVPISVLTPGVIRASDADQDLLTLTFTSMPSNGTLYFKNGEQLSVVTSASTFDSSSGSAWSFLYEPLAGEYSVCVDPKSPSPANCSPFTTVNFAVTDGITTVNQVLSIFVFPINDPPTGNNLVFTINEDENLTIVLTAMDPDDESSVLITRTTGIAPGSKGFLTTSAGVSVPFGSEQATEADKSILFTPVADDFSGANIFYSRFFYKVFDPSGLMSPEYTVTIFVLPVADELQILGDNFIRMNEDTVGSFVLGREGINWESKDKGEIFIKLTSVPDVGILSVCVESECTELTSADIGNDYNPLAVFSFLPPPNAYGENFTSFTYELILRPEGVNVATIVPVNFTIHVVPVNDPPVLVPYFPVDPLSTVFDEDTFSVMYFQATDIDTPLTDLSATIVHGLQFGVSMKVYSCPTAEDEANGCVNGTLISGSEIELVAISPARWAIGLNPIRNANGIARLTFVVSDGELSSAPVIAPITVRPINDAPEIFNATVTSTLDSASFSFTAKDVDFSFRSVAVSFTDLSALGSFDLSEFNLTSTPTDSSPCFLPVPSELKCILPIQSIPSWLELIRYRFGANNNTLKRQATNATTNSTDRQIQIGVDDMGNIDYRLDMDLNASVVLIAIPPLPETLVATTNPPADNAGLIAGTVAGLIVAGIAGALAIFFLKKKAADNVSSYFERMALDMDGTGNNSPLYSGAAKGGESALYKGGSIMQ